MKCGVKYSIKPHKKCTARKAAASFFSTGLMLYGDKTVKTEKVFFKIKFDYSRFSKQMHCLENAYRCLHGLQMVL